MKTPASGASSFGSLDRALRVFGLAGSGAGNESGSADRKSRLRLAEEKRLARLPKPARASFAVLKTHARLAAALRRCGEAETSRRAEAEGAHAGAARAAREARARRRGHVGGDGGCGVRGGGEGGGDHPAERRARPPHAEEVEKVLRPENGRAFEAARPAPAPVASTPRTDEARGDDDSSRRLPEPGTRRRESRQKSFLLPKRPDSDAESRYDESTQTLPEAEHRATQTPATEAGGGVPAVVGIADPATPSRRQARVARRARRGGRPPAETKYPVKVPWRPSNHLRLAVVPAFAEAAVGKLPRATWDVDRGVRFRTNARTSTAVVYGKSNVSRRLAPVLRSRSKNVHSPADIDPHVTTDPSLHALFRPPLS